MPCRYGGRRPARAQLVLKVLPCCLQLTKDHNAELLSQLEQLKSREGAEDHSKTSGNSLFGEVDDRRMNVEKKMISLKVKHESLERTNAITKQQLRKMKVCLGVTPHTR